MRKTKISGPAVFMYSTIVLTAVLAAVCFTLYYSAFVKSDFVLWIGIVSFMILYHFGLRIFMGEVTKRIRFNYNTYWYKTKSFEKPLYRLLRVRSWKDKVLTFDPASYDFQNRTLEQLAYTMTKSETDHWINEIISVISILFSVIWGCFPIFLVTAVAAMLFDAQFIVVQRYNRPVVLRLIEKKSRKKTKIEV